MSMFSFYYFHNIYLFTLEKQIRWRIWNVNIIVNVRILFLTLLITEVKCKHNCNVSAVFVKTKNYNKCIIALQIKLTMEH